MIITLFSKVMAVFHMEPQYFCALCHKVMFWRLPCVEDESVVDKWVRVPNAVRKLTYCIAYLDKPVLGASLQSDIGIPQSHSEEHRASTKLPVQPPPCTENIVSAFNVHTRNRAPCCLPQTTFLSGEEDLIKCLVKAQTVSHPSYSPWEPQHS